ncbi:hypothetical protein [Tumebacillus avium]|uniref:hypothetical protein n=1 Tax=Tumebacillus avium TaxID=1903704 RepID=UPI0012FDC618|nr:hypothetical protein [Tumebacillus avium]
MYLACSLDGFIATEDHGVEWLHEAARAENGDNGYSVFYNTVDEIVKGRFWTTRPVDV